MCTQWTQSNVLAFDFQAIKQTNKNRLYWVMFQLKQTSTNAPWLAIQIWSWVDYNSNAFHYSISRITDHSPWIHWSGKIQCPRTSEVNHWIFLHHCVWYCVVHTEQQGNILSSIGQANGCEQVWKTPYCDRLDD